MEQLFIKKIINQQLYNKINDININDIFNYYPDKIDIIPFINNNEDQNDDYEFIIDIDNSNLNEEEEKDKNDYLNKLKEEITRISKIIEYLIVNININKIKTLNYKSYNYDNTSKFIKNKIKSNNHNFDIKKFIIKNKIENTNDNNDNKMISLFILNKMIEIFNNYNKCLNYSLKLLEEYPYIIRNKNDYLSIIDINFFNMNNDEINVNHHNLIKNSYNSNNKQTTIINIKKNKDKNFEILFK